MQGETTLERKKRSVDEISIDMLKRLIAAEEQDVELRAAKIGEAVGVHYTLGKPILDDLEKRELVSRDAKKIYKITQRGRTLITMKLMGDKLIDVFEDFREHRKVYNEQEVK